MNESTAMALMDVVVGIMFIAVSVPLVLGKIGPNALYGFRIPAAFRSQEAWYDINAYGGRQLIYWSLALIASGILKILIPGFDDLDDTPAAVMIIFGPLLACAFIPIVLTLIYAARRPAGDTLDGETLIPRRSLRIQRVIGYALVIVALGAIGTSMYRGERTLGGFLIVVFIVVVIIADTVHAWRNR